MVGQPDQARAIRGHEAAVSRRMQSGFFTVWALSTLVAKGVKADVAFDRRRRSLIPSLGLVENPIVVSWLGVHLG